MPAKSKEQEKLMRAVANNPDFAKKVGIKQSVGKEFMKKYDKGGKVTTPEKEKQRIKDMAKEERMKKILTEDMKTFGPKEESKPVKKKEGGMLNKGRKITPEMRKKLEPGYRENYDKYRPKGFKTKDQMTEEEKKVLTKPMGKKKGGKIGMGMTKNNYKKGGKVSSCSKRADGCAVRGKTKGRMV